MTLFAGVCLVWSFAGTVVAVALAQSTSISVTVAWVLFGTEVEDSRNVGVFASGFASSPISFFRRRWLRGGRRRSDGDLASESALVVDLIRSGSATRGFVNVWWFVMAAWFHETSAGSGFVAAEVARNTDLVVFA